MGPTDYFGELSLLQEAPRAATVYTKSNTTVLELSKDKFMELMGDIHDQLAQKQQLYQQINVKLA